MTRARWTVGEGGTVALRRKFKLNSIFKGIWKKKQYSFDLG